MQSVCNKPARALCLVVWTLVACGDGAGTGELVIRVSGEGAAKQGYPFLKNNETIAFADGWQVRFSTFLIGLSDIRLRNADGDEVTSGPDVFVADLRQGDPEIVRFSGLAARRWDRFEFRIVAPTMNARALGQVAPAAIARMVEGGFNYWIEGTASKGTLSYAFAWGLRNPTRNSSCTNGVDGTDGFVVRSNATTVGEITIHVDHTFWDTLGTERARLRFDALAGASRDDATIDFAELEAQALTDLRGPGGAPLVDDAGALIIYNPGSVPIGAPTLGAFVLASAASQAHVNGLGLCTVSRL